MQGAFLWVLPGYSSTGSAPGLCCGYQLREISDGHGLDPSGSDQTEGKHSGLKNNGFSYLEYTGGGLDKPETAHARHF